MFNNWPYTNLNELNLDWILQQVKDIQDKYTDLDSAIAAGVEAVQQQEQTSLQDLDNMKMTIVTAINGARDIALVDVNATKTNAINDITTAQGTAESAIAADKTNAQAAIETDKTAALAAITALGNTWDDHYESLIAAMPADLASLTQTLAILGRILTGESEQTVTFFLGDYAGGSKTTPTPAATSDVSTNMTIGGAGFKFAFTLDDSVDADTKIYAIRWFEGKNASTGVYTDEHIVSCGNVRTYYWTVPDTCYGFSITLRNSETSFTEAPSSDIATLRWYTTISDFVSVDGDQNFTQVQKAQGRENIGAASEEDYAELDSEITDLKSAINDITGPNKNLLYYYPWASSGANATFVDDNIIVTATSSSTYRMVYFDIPVNGHDAVTLSYNSKSSESQGTNAAGVRVGFMKNGTNTWQEYVSSSPATYNTLGVDEIRIGLYVATSSVDVGTKSTFNKIQVEYGDTATTFSKAKYDAVDRALQAEVEELELNIPVVVVDALTEIGLNKYNPDTKVTGFINANTGTINPNTDYFTSDFIDVSEFSKGYAFTPKARKILFYDANKNAIAASYYTDETSAGVISLNSSYKYVRMSWYKTSTNVMVCDASTLPQYQPYEIVAKNGINYLNNDTEAKVRQMVEEGGKSSQIATFLNGKTVLVFGDSIMHGAGNNDDGIADLLADKYGMVASDYSVSGATMGVRTDSPSYTVDEVHHIAKQVRNAIAASVSPDLIIFNGGTNDIGGEIPIGTMSEVYTQPASESYFADGFETVAYLLMSNFVGVPIIYMRAHNMSSRSYTGQKTFGELGNQIAEKWGIRTVDMYKRMNTQIAAYRTAYLADYTHPNAAGYNKYYIPAIEDFIFSELI